MWPTLAAYDSKSISLLAACIYLQSRVREVDLPVMAFDWLKELVLAFGSLKELVLALDWLKKLVLAFDWLKESVLTFDWLEDALKRDGLKLELSNDVSVL